MATEQEKISLELRGATVAEILPFVEMAERFSTSGGEFGAEELAADCARYVFVRDGVPVCGWLLAIQGDEIFIPAAGAVDALDFTKLGLAAIEAMAKRHFKAVSFETKRRGLIRKAQKLGYVIDGAAADGVLMKKRLQ